MVLPELRLHALDQKYLDASVRLAKKFISRLDTEIVPMWGILPFHAGVLQLRDASAASVAACGFQGTCPAPSCRCLLSINAQTSAASNGFAAMIISILTSACPGVQKNGRVGNAKNAYTSWGDYYLMEALARELYQIETWW